MTSPQRLLPLLIVLAALGLPQHAPAEAAAIRWDRVVGANPGQMNAAQRERAAAFLRQEYSYFGCSRTVARCLEADRPSRTAQRLAGYIVRQVLESRSDDEIREGVRQRGLSAHPLQRATIDLANAQCHGPANAPVTVVEYADFECPFCRVFSPMVHRVVTRMQPNVRLCFKHFPVRGHSRALASSLAALAAERQGRFWQIHDRLYASSPRLADSDLERCAREAGVADLARWRRDMGDGALRTLIESDKLEGLRNGVRATPTFFINGKLYLGRKNEVEFRDRLEEELDLAQGRE